MSSDTGKVVVISGPSGVGKSTICHRLCERMPAEFSVSVTTRTARPGETRARDYHYVTREEFDRLRESGKLLEWAEVYGHLYGTPLEPIEEAVRRGRVIILEIDIQGCVQVRRMLPTARTFFILPPSSEEQRRRIEGRRTDPSTTIRERLAKADGEIRFAIESGCYDEFIVNDDLDQTVTTICRKILGNERVPSR
jgi:guanylate kinase